MRHSPQKWIACIIGLICCITIPSFAANQLKTVGIIVPLTEEAPYIQQQLTSPKIITTNGITYQIGTIHHHRVILVNSGLGKINAAITTTRLINDFKPEMIMVVGSSGGINPALKKGDVVIGKEIIDADFGQLSASGSVFQYDEYLLNPHNHQTLPLTFHLSPLLTQRANAITTTTTPHVVLGNIATSDALPNDAAQVALLKQAKMDVIEMEGTAVMHTCWLFNMPCLVIRGISNSNNEVITKADIETAAENAERVAIKLIQ